MTTDIQKRLNELCSLYRETEKKDLPRIILPQLYLTVNLLKKDDNLVKKINQAKIAATEPLIELANPILESLNHIRQRIKTYLQTNLMIAPYAPETPIINGTLLLESLLIENYYRSIVEFLQHLMTINAPSKATILDFVSQIAIIKDVDNRVIIPQPISIERLDILFQKVILFIDTYRIYNGHITKCITDFKNCSHVKQCTNNDALLCKYSALISLLQLLIRPSLSSDHHLWYVKKYATIDEQGNILSLKIDKQYDLFLNEKRSIENTKNTAVWGALEKLIIFPECYEKYGLEAIISRYYNSRRILGVCSTEEYYQYVLIILNFIEKNRENTELEHNADEAGLTCLESRESNRSVKNKEHLKVIRIEIEPHIIKIFNVDGERSYSYEKYQNTKSKIKKIKRWDMVERMASAYPNCIDKKTIKGDVHKAYEGVNEELKDRLNIKDLIDGHSMRNKLKFNENYHIIISIQAM